MAILNLAQAARATGKTRTTIKKWIVSGRLSATRDAQNRWVIDTAELERAGWIVKRSGQPEVPGVGQLLDDVKDLNHKIRLLEVQLESKTEMLEHQKSISEERQRHLQYVWEEYNDLKNQMKLLSSPKVEASLGTAENPIITPAPELQVIEGRQEEPKAAPKKRGWWPWSKAA